MKLHSALMAAVAIGAVIAPAAHAAEKKHAKHHAAKTAPAGAKESALKGEVDELKAEVAALRDELKTQRDTTAATQTQVAQTQAEVVQTQTQVQQIAATPAATKEDVKTAIAASVEKEHHNDGFYFKGIKITPGGFLEMAGIYRDHYMGQDMPTSWASIPFPTSNAYHTGETRLSARQSRVSFLAQGKPSDKVTLSMYGEFDFLGGAQTANSNETNSFNPRIRHLYGTIDWNAGSSGWHLLAGQNWSLATLNSKGITPRAEVTPAVIDAQYVPGFVFARQPQLRLTGDFFDHQLWIALSAENAATQTLAGSIPTSVSYRVAASGGFDSANYLSYNNLPDFIQKIAYEGNIAGHALHLEGFAIERNFTVRVNGLGNINKGAVGFGGGATLQVVPQYLDLQFSGLSGKGMGRYGAAQLPDATLDVDGSIHAIKETMLLAGMTVHPTKMLDIYAYAGEEYQDATPLTGSYGTGLASANDSGCFTETTAASSSGTAASGTCSGNTHRVRQIAVGFWQKIYQGSFGRAQVGATYSYTQRDLFATTSYGAPRTDESIGMLSFRYYPF
jgi:hypothetical protein